MSCSDSAQCNPGHFCLAPSLPEGERLLVINRATPAELPLTQQQHGKRVLTWSRSEALEQHAEFEKKVKDVQIGANVTRVLSKRGGKQDTVSQKVSVTAKSEGASTAVRLRRSVAKKFTTNKSTKPKNNSLLADHGHVHKDRKLSKIEYQAVNAKPTSAEKVPVAQSHTKPDDGDDHHTHDSDVPSDFTAVLYLGSPALLYQTVTVSDYVPRFSFISLGWGEALLKLLDYIIKFSGALALLNLVPCVYLDGEYITEALVEGCLGSVMSRLSRSTLITAITWSGTVLLVANVAVGMMSLL